MKLLGLLAVAFAFAPNAGVRTTVAVHEKTALMADTEKMLGEAYEKGKAKFESIYKDLTLELKENEKAAEKKMIMNRLDNIESVLGEIKDKLK